MSKRPLASLSLDLDNLWSYMKTHGDPGWQSFPSYLDIAVPRVLEVLEKHGLTITFFIVGQDAALEKNHDALSRISSAGHEIGSHSFKHEPWLHRYSEEEVEAELANAEDAIHQATGVRPRCFRGPGFSISTAVLKSLVRRGYLFDASTFPTFIGPLARAYYFFNAGLSREERQKRKELFGGVVDGLRPLKPYAWRLDEGLLPEIPVSTMPLTRLPFHISYIQYLASHSQALARTYFRTALRFCLMGDLQPSLLLHPLDFLGSDDTNELRFFPGMQEPAEAKLAMVDWALKMFGERYEVLPMLRYVDRLTTQGELRQVCPNFDNRFGPPEPTCSTSQRSQSYSS